MNNRHNKDNLGIQSSAEGTLIVPVHLDLNVSINGFRNDLELLENDYIVVDSGLQIACEMAHIEEGTTIVAIELQHTTYIFDSYPLPTSPVLSN